MLKIKKPETARDHIRLCRSYVGSAYRMRSFAVSGFSFMYFRTGGPFRSDTLRFLKHDTGHVVECLNV